MKVRTRHGLIFSGAIFCLAAIWIAVAGTWNPFAALRGQMEIPNLELVKLSPSHFSWETGSRATYSLHAMTIMGDPSKGFSQTSIGGKVEIQSNLHIKVLAQQKDKVFVGAQFSSVHFIADGSAIKEINESIASTPFIIEFSQEGAILSMHFNQNLDLGTQRLIRAAIDIQVVLPKVLSNEWGTVEIDANGTFASFYKTLNYVSIEKQKLRYVNLSNEKTGFFLQFNNACYSAVIGAPWLKSYCGGEELDIISTSGSIISKSRVSTDLQLIKSNYEPDGLGKLVSGQVTSKIFQELQNLPVQPVSIDDLSQRIQDRKIREIYENMSLDKVFSNLFTAVMNSTSHADTISFIEDMRNWLLVHPDKAGMLAQKLSDPSLPLEVTARVINAFELSSMSQPSQEALASILASAGTYSPAVQAQAAVAAGGIGQTASNSLSDALFKAAFDIDSGSQESQDAALLALGVLSESNEAIAESLISVLGINLNPHENVLPIDRVVAMQALANGRISTEPIVKSVQELLKNNSDSAVRGEAFNYLNSTDQMTPTDLGVALGDRDENVRFLAINLVRSSESADQLVITRLVSLAGNPTSSDSLRVASVAALKHHSESYPIVATEMQQLLKSNVPSAVREAIQSEFSVR